MVFNINEDCEERLWAELELMGGVSSLTSSRELRKKRSLCTAELNGPNCPAPSSPLHMLFPVG